LDFRLIEDTPVSEAKRWVVVAGDHGARLLLARATTPRQIAAIGAAAGDRVAYFLECDDFEARYARMAHAGVQFLEKPRHEPYGKVAVFTDLYGGRWDLIQPTTPFVALLS
jgi:uncharacterized glyoxalase superfamily protein PhnB